VKSLGGLKVAFGVCAIGAVCVASGCKPVSPTARGEQGASAVNSYVPEIVFDRAILALSASLLVQYAIPFQYAPDGCYARALLMSAYLAARGIPSSQYYVFAEDDFPLEINWRGTPVLWRYHVAPLIQPYGKEAQIYDPSVTGKNDETLTREQWISKFVSSRTVLSKEWLLPGSCYVQDSMAKAPRPECAPQKFPVKLVRAVAEMPKFRMVDLNEACSDLGEYLGEPEAGFLPNQVGLKRRELQTLVSETVAGLSAKGVLEGKPSELSCVRP
jgi:hypothetical protein